MAGRLETKE